MWVDFGKSGLLTLIKIESSLFFPFQISTIVTLYDLDNIHKPWQDNKINEFIVTMMH